jgi:hypothetical protein
MAATGACSAIHTNKVPTAHFWCHKQMGSLPRWLFRESSLEITPNLIKISIRKNITMFSYLRGALHNEIWPQNFAKTI